ncbi:MAG: hypothetical protein ACD_30C00044G0004 [uncultured bacterium]|nr:MAG: hypothetical protein ACD_30C00044G0004 [uncultured bacterium]
MEEPVSSILNKFPVVVPFVPIFKANKSPVAVVADPGLQSKLAKDPIPAVPVKTVEVEERLSILPEVKPLAVIEAKIPLVAELAVKLNIPVPVYIPVFVIAKSAPEVLVVAIETMSLAVAGERVVPDLDQKPEVPEDPPVIFPVQVKSPVVPESVTVQRVFVPSCITMVPPSAKSTLEVVSLR